MPPWNNVRTMGNCSSLLRPLSTVGSWCSEPSVTSSSPPFVPISSLSKRPCGTRSLMTWQCTSVKRSYLCYSTRNATAWTGLSSPPRPAPLTAGAPGPNLCLYLSVWLQIMFQLARCKLTLLDTWIPRSRCRSVLSVYIDFHTGFSKNQR